MGDIGAKTRKRLIIAAEYLMARHGLAGVTTQDILRRAGQRNRSALHYHFGSKEGLIRAALVEQMTRVDGRRAGLLRMPGANSAEGVMRAFILPLAEDISNMEGGHQHLSLLSQVVHSPEFDFEELVRQTRLPGICGAMDRLWEIMPPVSQHVQALRYRTTFSACLSGLLQWQSDMEPAAPGQFTEELITAFSPIISRPPGTKGAIHL